MLKPIAKSSELTTKQLNDDIQFLLSNIRARENGLIFFLERFTEQCKTQDEFGIYKEQFLQKQKIYANQIHKVISKLSEDNKYQQEIKQYTGTFWIKVKSIIKVSLDRLRMLKLLNQRIFTRYEEIINLINTNYDQQKKIEQFNSIENLLKKRNVDALIYSRNYFDSPGSDNKICKNRSESAFKHSSKYTSKPLRLVEDSFGNQAGGLAKLIFEDELEEEKDPQIRMKSLNRYRRKKLILGKNTVEKTSEKIYKKITKSLDKYQKGLQGAMECIIDLDIDKKKSVKENSEALYDELFNRNIPNHKMISKFLFGACGIAQLLIKRKQLKNKKSLLGKTDKNQRESKDGEKKIRLKQSKELKEKDKEKEKEKQKEKEKEKQKQKEKDKQKFRQKSKDRPQTSLTAQIKGIFQQQKKRMIQTTLILQDKKNSKYKRKIGGRIQKYTKMVKLIS